MGIWSKLSAFASVNVFRHSGQPTSPEAAPIRATRSPFVEKSICGHLPDGTPIESYVLGNSLGSKAKLISYGASLTELSVPDRKGQMMDVVLGFDNPHDYLGPHPFFGGTIGRFANRIAKGHFVLDGQAYDLAINDPPNSLHGGKVGFDHRVWKAQPVKDGSSTAVCFSYLSKDGEENYPGNVSVTVTYSLSETNELKLEYTGESDKSTPINLTNHSYFNLAGSGDIFGHILYLNADQYTPVDATLIPTGELRRVEGTPLDFRKPTTIGERIGQLTEVGGYDHNFVVNGKAGTMRLAARLAEPGSGRQMEVWTTEPAIQFYSGIHLKGNAVGKGGTAYQKSAGLCLETQHYPDSPNHPDFPSTILQPGSWFHSETIYKFLAE